MMVVEKTPEEERRGEELEAGERDWRQTGGMNLITPARDDLVQRRRGK
jgi:hypothetical protein